MSLQSFLEAMDRSLKKNAEIHLDWKKDDVRPLLRRRVLEDMEFWVRVFLNRRGDG